jgi:hypothetical protein
MTHQFPWNTLIIDRITRLFKKFVFFGILALNQSISFGHAQEKSHASVWKLNDDVEDVYVGTLEEAFAYPHKDMNVPSESQFNDIDRVQEITEDLHHNSVLEKPLILEESLSLEDSLFLNTPSTIEKDNSTSLETASAKSHIIYSGSVKRKIQPESIGSLELSASEDDQSKAVAKLGATFKFPSMGGLNAGISKQESLKDVVVNSQVIWQKIVPLHNVPQEIGAPVISDLSIDKVLQVSSQKLGSQLRSSHVVALEPGIENQKIIEKIGVNTQIIHRDVIVPEKISEEIGSFSPSPIK